MRTWRFAQRLKKEDLLEFLDATLKDKAPRKIEILTYELALEVESLREKEDSVKNTLEWELKTKERSITASKNKIKKLKRLIEFEDDK